MEGTSRGVAVMEGLSSEELECLEVVEGRRT